MWGTVLKRDLLGETREEDKIHSKDELIKHLYLEIEKQGKNVVIRNLDVSLIDDLSHLFDKIDDIDDNVKTLDLSGWKTSNVKNMSHIFYNCINLESLDLSGWDTSNVTDMSNMFFWCDSLKSLDVSGWDTSNVKNMRGAFRQCESLESLDLSGWDVSNVEDMNGMFWGCMNLKSLDLSSWNTSNVEDMNGMFGFCKSLESLNLSGWDTSKVKDMNDMFWCSSAPYKVGKNKKIKRTKSNKSVIFVVNKSNHTIKLCGEQY